MHLTNYYLKTARVALGFKAGFWFQSTPSANWLLSLLPELIVPIVVCGEHSFKRNKDLNEKLLTAILVILIPPLPQSGLAIFILSLVFPILFCSHTSLPWNLKSFSQVSWKQNTQKLPSWGWIYLYSNNQRSSNWNCLLGEEVQFIVVMDQISPGPIVPFFWGVFFGFVLFFLVKAWRLLWFDQEEKCATNQMFSSFVCICSPNTKSVALKYILCYELLLVLGIRPNTNIIRLSFLWPWVYSLVLTSNIPVKVRDLKSSKKKTTVNK